MGAVMKKVDASLPAGLEIRSIILRGSFFTEVRHVEPQVVLFTDADCHGWYHHSDRL